MSPIEKKWLKIAAVLHDIGKIGIEDQILRKPAQLSPEEYDVIKHHSDLGAEIIEHIRQLKEIVPGVKFHHEQVRRTRLPERVERRGYPFPCKDCVRFRYV